ncbi:Lsa36 family surface (lipo)protein [Breznakiellaceae bacterium SP9]
MVTSNKYLFSALIVVLFLAGGFSAAAIEITGTPPVFHDNLGLATAFNSAMATAWDDMLDEFNDGIKGISGKPEKMIKSFADAAVFSNHAATLRGYGKPDYFSFSVGAMVGGKVGVDIDDVADYADDFADKIKTEGDLAIGAGVGVSAQFTLNASFLVNGLSLGFRYGGFEFTTEDVKEYADTNTDLDKFKGSGFKTQSIGITANYQLFKERNPIPYLLKWRGISLGSGVFYQKTDLTYAMKVDVGPQSLTGAYSGVNLKVDPRLLFNMTTETYTVPLEITTAIQLLSLLNITVGGGADLAVGKNTMTFGASADANVDGLPSSFTQEKAGYLEATGGGEMTPTYYNPKLIAGVGLKLGPIILDVPVTYYFGDGLGASAGVTLGIMW